MTLGLLLAGSAFGREFEVKDDGGLRRALDEAKAGDSIVLLGSDYSGGIYAAEKMGRKGMPITIRGKNPSAPPLIKGGGGTGIHLSGCNFVVLRDIRVDGFPMNGINIDDASKKGNPSIGILLENVVVTSTGPRGNHDALKMSGVDQFAVRNCRFVGWGGSGIDMVGCHDGVIEGCHFEGKDGFSQSNGVQAKGGSARVKVLNCFFRNPGHRGINIGGSTGRQYFRPKLEEFEAQDIEVAGCRFVGGMAAVAWVSCDGGHVHHNTIYQPTKWVVRILQESTGDPFKAAHGGVFENNLVVYDRRVSVFANVGGGTAPETFSFRNNAWYQSDGGGRQRPPSLPVKETGGVIGKNPELENAAEPTMGIGSVDPNFRDKGADAWKK